MLCHWNPRTITFCSIIYYGSEQLDLRHEMLDLGLSTDEVNIDMLEIQSELRSLRETEERFL